MPAGSLHKLITPELCSESKQVGGNVLSALKVGVFFVRGKENGDLPSFRCEKAVFLLQSERK